MEKDYSVVEAHDLHQALPLYDSMTQRRTAVVFLPGLDSWLFVDCLNCVGVKQWNKCIMVKLV